MTRENKRRLVLYSAAVIIVSGLVYGGFIHEAEPDPLQLLNQAEILAKVGSFDEAIADAERALVQDPDNRYGYIILAYCYAETGRYDESIALYRRAVELTEAGDETLGSLRLHLAETLLEAGRPEEAEREALDVVKGDAGQYQAWHIVARARRESGRIEGAREACLAARASAPDDLTSLALLALIEEEAGNGAEAISRMREALRARPGDPRFSVTAARLLVAENRREEAVEVLLGVSEKGRRVAARLARRQESLATLLEDERLRSLVSGSEKKVEESQEQPQVAPAGCR